MTERTRRPARMAARGSTLVITNAIKVFGLFLAVREVLRPQRDEFVLALAAFMMSGSQLSEEFFLRLIDGLLGNPHGNEVPEEG